MLDTLTIALLVYGLASVLSLWLGMVFWVYRDIRSRSRDTLTQGLSVITVLFLNIPGFLLYLFLRPRETLTESYERSLEEEALLQEIEEKSTCPGCGQHVQENWQVCPNCHTQLKRVCHNCRRLLDLTWGICPYCTATQQSIRQETIVRSTRRRDESVSPQQLEFIESDES